MTTEITEAGIREALANIIDPDLHRDIVSLGFVKDLQIDGADVSLTIELTTPACPIKEKFRTQADERIRKSYPDAGNIAINMSSQVRAGQRVVPERADFLKTVKHPILVASGKGGVGKSTIAVNLALALAEDGAAAGLMDADAYGPSFPTMLGVRERAQQASPSTLMPIERFGLRTMSIGYLIDEGQPVIWRGPMLDSLLKQFMTQVEWGELDYLVIDLPPGTGDVQLTLAQNCPATGAVIVTTPQDVALADVRRAIQMFQHMNMPVLGIIENMAGFVCPSCGAKSDIFLTGGGEKAAKQFDIPFLGSIPLVPEIPDCGDKGTPYLKQNPDTEVANSIRAVARHLAHQASVKALAEPDPAGT